MAQFELTFKAFGQSALLIEWPARLEENILNDILRLQNALENESIDGVVETVNAYNSLTVLFNPLKVNVGELQQIIKKLHLNGPIQKTKNNKTWEIPVCYDSSFGLDLEELSQSKKISTDELIQLHCQQTYLVYFIGFLPGFLYLGGLPEKLHAPRRSSPRLKINRGAVAIGGMQTGVYPSESPGGWNIIGNSPIDFFNPKSNPPCFAKAGDRIQFFAVNMEGYKDIRDKILKGEYKIETN
ncbi:MAG: 5-oxoprolinase subunit PxpB [Cyclobacteriaceae bacterium]